MNEQECEFLREIVSVQIKWSLMRDSSTASANLGWRKTSRDMVSLRAFFTRAIFLPEAIRISNVDVVSVTGLPLCSTTAMTPGLKSLANSSASSPEISRSSLILGSSRYDAVAETDREETALALFLIQIKKKIFFN